MKVRVPKKCAFPSMLCICGQLLGHFWTFLFQSCFALLCDLRVVWQEACLLVTLREQEANYWLDFQSTLTRS